MDERTQSSLIRDPGTLWKQIEEDLQAILDNITEATREVLQAEDDAKDTK